MSYTAPSNNAVDFDLETYTPPANDAVDFTLGGTTREVNAHVRKTVTSSSRVVQNTVTVSDFTGALVGATSRTGEFYVSGKVTLSGSGVDGAEVYVINDDTQEVITRQTTDANGNYSVQVPEGTTIHVAVQYEDGTDQYNDESKPFIVA